ncbi:hypothetical protein DICTH_0281 [Dictyoglomus thermophilum H-6-12]|uniref:Uncharacterized protein n=1 Tax=Dictyoglomus thermophilum (strain ATCC 35947 / DSM 3960 / H-6-12) TaxID=309799 RepID=B5YC56_DICT6|nr:hypothetical protein DICTH_0281 [Dictyoglomus thermophilum H-6-12]
MITLEAKRTGFSYRRLKALILRKYSLSISENTIKKHLLDKTSLPTDVYNHLVKFNLPQYEWNIIDAKTRTRFTAYSFIIFVVLWLRAHNVRH